MHRFSPPLYSVDASAMIQLKDDYPPDVFVSLWDFLGGMADAGRLLACQEIRDECHDQELVEFFRDHPRAVADFGELQDHLLALQAEASALGLEMVNPDSPRHQADPFVVALALALDGRDAVRLMVKVSPAATCHVVTYERARGAQARLKAIPDVCAHYRLVVRRWPEVLRAQGYSG